MKTCQSKFWSRREDVWDVNKQDVDWRHFMMLPSSLSGTGPLPPLSCGQMDAVLWTSVKTKTCHSVFSSLTHRLSWEHRQADAGPQISERTSEEIICSRGYTQAGLLIQALCVRNLWFWIRLRVMTVTWTNQIWQKIISWPSFDLKILKTGIISMLGARLVNR